MTPATFSILPGESLSGFLRRYARSQGYTQLSDFTTWLGWSYGRPLVEELPTVAVKLGVEIGELEEIAPKVRPEDPLREWRFHRPHRDSFCPACLAGGRPWQQAWRHCLVSACPDHGVRLRDTCDRCQEPITPQDGGFSACQCGYPLAEMITCPAGSGEIEIALLYAAGRSRLSALMSGTEARDPEINRLFQFLSSHSRRKRTGKEGKEGLPMAVDDTVRYMLPVLDILVDWPGAFDKEVARRWKRSSVNGQTAPQRLGRWYQQLFTFEGRLARVLQERLLATVATNFGDPYSTDGSRDEGWISAAEAGRKLGIRAERIVAAVAAGDVEGRVHHSGFGHRHTLVPSSAIARIARTRADVVTATDMLDLLGVSKKQFALLLECGAIREIPTGDRAPLVDGRFSRSTVINSVRAIALGQAGDRTEGGATVTFREVSLRRTTDRLGLLAIYKAIFGGTLHPVNADPDGMLGDFLFRSSDVNARFSDALPGSMTARDVSAATGWKHECVTHWCKIGLLNARQTRQGGLESWAIEAKDLCHFQSTFAVLADVARQRGTSPRALLAACERARISTVGAKAVGSTTRGHLVRIRDLPDLYISEQA
ncbi:TniQ family protein [Defluviimonas salinarum]|uniref:TniQ family protein n=1 Tax=Defluviimonas salinarum TaxID=2992147 RepID=A0ABT3JB83_9RHOB|nr:TniQ family protein [Defluviimonas salinarum]MCW3784705.1 TniQ family protein [Defluviimonas salinarum]